MRKFISMIIFILLFAISAQASKKMFITSFGNGGLTSYEIIDNVCYGYLIEPKNKKIISKAINKALTVSIQKVKKTYIKKADGFINIKFLWGEYEKRSILYQVCGDVVITAKER